MKDFFEVLFDILIVVVISLIAFYMAWGWVVMR